jgi:hypothetical protein
MKNNLHKGSCHLVCHDETLLIKSSYEFTFYDYICLRKHNSTLKHQKTHELRYMLTHIKRQGDTGLSVKQTP